MQVVALILAAGRGQRLGADRPKALVLVAGRSPLEWSALALGRARGVAAVLPVLPGDALDACEAFASGWSQPARLLRPVAGGATRQESVAHGLEGLMRAAPHAEWVLVHDSARCLVEPGDAEAVLAAARASSGAAVPLAPVSDTVKRVEGGRVVETLDRTRLGLAQTPQAFRVEVLKEALEKARREGFVGSDCASLVERLGVEVRACPGRRGNWKLTHPEDLERAEAILGQRQAP